MKYKTEFMTKDNLHDKFEHVFKVVQTEKFLNMEALGGEIPFWISSYNPSQEVDVNTEIQNLQTKLQNNGIKPLVIDLFQLSMDIIDKHVGLDNIFQIEVKKKKESFKRALQSTINIHERVIPEIKAMVDEFHPQVLIICGVGKVYPFIRSHNVLNNLQSAISTIPTLMFFPGNYTGKSLELFGLMRDDNYYRAFNIDNFKQ